jgi:hypothetical protein
MTKQPLISYLRRIAILGLLLVAVVLSYYTFVQGYYYVFPLVMLLDVTFCVLLEWWK